MDVDLSKLCELLAGANLPLRLTDNACCFHSTGPIAIEDETGNVLACNTTYYPTELDADFADLIVEGINALPLFLSEIEELRQALVEADSKNDAMSAEWNKAESERNELSLDKADIEKAMSLAHYIGAPAGCIEDLYNRVTKAEAELTTAREALEKIASRAETLRKGTDDWFELAEFEMMARSALPVENGS